MPSIIRHAAAVFLLAACGCAFADVTVEAPWIRGVVAGQSSTGAFMTLRSTEAAELVGMSSPAAESLQVHKTAMVDGMMTMEPVDALAVPAHGSVALEPGGPLACSTGHETRIAISETRPTVHTSITVSPSAPATGPGEPSRSRSW